ncbi:MAG: hypothetical protein U9O94_05695 [Nanoarchaeota archaeon]|nr:hypothetical protein [Nanoarchaeota archaeon]
MNEKTLEIVLGKKTLFVPLIFTNKQFNILEKYSRGLRLSNAEKKALYTSIKKKMEALDSFLIEQKDLEYWVNSPDEIIPSRLKEAKKILEEYSKKHKMVFIAGSFLFSKRYGDMDIFVIRERGYKEEHDGNKHIVFLPEKKLFAPIFQSASLISVSNFRIPKKLRKKRHSLSEIMATYHEAVIERMRKEEKPEAIRNLVFEYNLRCKDLINGKQLKEISDKVTLDEMDIIMKTLCMKLFSATYLYVEVHTYIQTLKESIKNIKLNKHLIIFKNTYEEMIYGRQRSKAEAT